MSINHTNSIVRLLDDKGGTAGTGFFISPRKIVTCAHVVELAGGSPGQSVSFALSNGGTILQAKVAPDCWGPPSREDVALLEVHDGTLSQLNTNIEFFRLGTSLSSINQVLNTFGFPATSPVEGLAGRCDVIATITLDGLPALQVRSPEIAPGYSGAPVWSRETGLMIGMVVSVARGGEATLDRQKDTAFVIPVETIRRVCKVELPEDCPYRGLEMFKEADEEDYFGRDQAIEALVKALTAQKIVSIFGVSGSGKSSLVRAGLTKGLRRYPAPGIANLQRCIVRPGQAPFLNLLLGVAEVAHGGTIDVEQQFHLPPRTLGATNADVREALREQPAAKLAITLREYCRMAGGLLLIIDQFERLFTECHDSAIRTRYMDIITEAASDDLKIVIAIKADYYAYLLMHPGMANFIQAGSITLHPMTKTELQQAIELPAERRGRVLEPEVLHKFIEEVQGRAGDLPLLQFALQELWRKDAASGILSLSSYEALGFESPGQKVTGARGAIVRRAEEIWYQLIKARTADKAKRVFLALVIIAKTDTITKDNGSSFQVLDVSRRARLSEFDKESRQVAEELASSFLLTTGRDPYSGEPTIEVAHEALIRNWRTWSKSVGRSGGR